MSSDSHASISVIIPCYNHASYLSETVHSVLNSSFKNLEIIIIDDGSKDKSFEIAKSLASQYGNISAYTQVNSGPSKTRNTGISKAIGTYILPLDADDLISDNYISEGISILEKNPNIMVAYAKAKKFDAVNKVWNLKPFSHLNLAKDNMIYVSGIFRKSDWERIGGYSESKDLVREDWEFWIKMLKDGGQAFQMPFYGFLYRIHGDSRRRSMTKIKKEREVDYLNSHHAEFFKKHLGGKLQYNRSLSKPINWLKNLFKFH